MKSTRMSVLGGIAALGLVGLVPSVADAATATVTGTVSGSNLSVATSASPSFSDNLDNGDQTQNYTIPLTAQDTRGTGAGWNLSILSTQFTTGGSTPTTLATNASSISSVSSGCATGTCTNPSNKYTTYPIAVPASGSTATPFFDAGVNTGMGKFTITPTIGVFVPQSTPSGSYSSTVTISIASTP